MNFGPVSDEAHSFEIMDEALSQGINFFDTADVYGWKPNQGWTEEIIGRWFAQGGERRERVVLATKCYNGMGKGSMEDWPNTDKLSARHIRQACDASLKRLQTDYIDLYQMHHVDRESPWEEIWQAMETLVQQGKILYVGSSNFGGWHIAQANERAKSRNFLGLVSEQSKYHLLQREVEMEVAPACEAYGMGILPWSPLASGVLAGKPEGSVGRRTDGWAAEVYSKHATALDQWWALCSELGERPADVALAWLIHQKAVCAPIIGPRTKEQLVGSIRAAEIDLSAEVLAKIDTIFPGFKTSPEHYAW